MRREVLYLTDIVEAADAIARFMGGLSRDEFLHDELRQSAILQKLMVIGEAAAHLSPEFRAAHPGRATLFYSTAERTSQRLVLHFEPIQPLEDRPHLHPYVDVL
jgi:uncharacterized protein with HEPN domain